MDEISAAQPNHTGKHGLYGVASTNFTPGGGSNWHGIRANLAEMEKTLGQLQQQVDPESQSPPHTPSVQLTPAGQAQVVQVKQQIEDLLRVRELLRDSLRGAIGECERVLGALDGGASPPSGAGGVEPHGMSMAAAVAPVAAVAGEIAVRPSVFQGRVSLRVGPLEDISQVDTLEIALLQVPGAEHVEVKEFSGRDAVAEIRLFQPVRLVEELHRVLPFSFEVTAGDATSLTLLALSGKG